MNILFRSKGCFHRSHPFVNVAIKDIIYFIYVSSMIQLFFFLKKIFIILGQMLLISLKIQFFFKCIYECNYFRFLVSLDARDWVLFYYFYLIFLMSLKYFFHKIIDI
jgi:hypothetical protein